MSIRLQNEREITVRQLRKAKREIEVGDVGGAIHTLSFLVDWLERRERIMSETETPTPEPEPEPTPEPEEPEPEEPQTPVGG
jgi:hypothetical protein